MIGKSLKVFILGEEPDSLKTIELGNWSGKAIVGNRVHLESAMGREELKQPAVYFLLSPDPVNPAVTHVYVGEAEDFSERIKTHEKEKDWWEVFVVFTSKDSNLTKAHIRYLEKWFYSRASSAHHRVKLKNGNTPPGSKLPEADVADMEVFAENALFVLGVLGYSLFSKSRPVDVGDSVSAAPRIDSAAPVFEIVITKEHVWPDGGIATGKMRIESGAYLLLAGSAVRLKPRESFEKQDHSYWQLWNSIVSDVSQVERITEDLGRLISDTPFTSPSAAAAVVRGGTTNGRTDWKIAGSGKSLKDWEFSPSM